LRSSSTAPLLQFHHLPAQVPLGVHFGLPVTASRRRITAAGTAIAAAGSSAAAHGRQPVQGQAPITAAAAPGPASLRGGPPQTAAGPRRSGSRQGGTPWGWTQVGTGIFTPDRTVRLVTGACFWAPLLSAIFLAAPPSRPFVAAASQAVPGASGLFVRPGRRVRAKPGAARGLREGGQGSRDWQAGAEFVPGGRAGRCC